MKILSAKTLNILLLSGYLLSCGSVPDTRPKWTGKIFAGDHENSRVYRKQSEEVVNCTDERFSKGIWISYEDFGCLGEQYLFNVKEFIDPNKECSKPSESMIKYIIEKQQDGE